MLCIIYVASLGMYPVVVQGTKRALKLVNALAIYRTEEAAKQVKLRRQIRERGKRALVKTILETPKCLLK